MPQLRIARADMPRANGMPMHAVFSSDEVRTGTTADWLVGRAAECRMRIEDDEISVSRLHVQVMMLGNQFHLRNLSQFGTEIEGRRITGSDTVPIGTNLSVTIGKVRLRCTLLVDREANELGWAPEPVHGVPPPAPSVDVEWSHTPASFGYESPASPTPWDSPLGSGMQGQESGALHGELQEEVDEVPSVGQWNDNDASVAGWQKIGGGVGFHAQGKTPEFSGDEANVDWTPRFSPAAGIGNPVAQPVAEVAKQAGAAPISPPAGTAETIAAILQSAGLREDVAKLRAAECPPEKIGMILAGMLRGLIEAQAARRSVKNTLRVAHTEARIAGNNPLLHAMTPAEALLALVQTQRAEYLPAEQAIAMTFGDLGDHEMAIVGGLQAAFNEVLESMSPDSMERTAGAASSKGFGQMHRNAKLWAQYRSRYAELYAGGRAFTNQFLPTFRDTYDAALNKLRAQKRQHGAGP